MNLHRLLNDISQTPVADLPTLQNMTELADDNFDYIDQCEREIALVTAFKEQVRFARTHIPFWQNRYSNELVDETTIEKWSDIGDVPILTKEEFRSIPPLELVPKKYLPQLCINRWTSGTTGNPTVACWTYADWNAAVASVTRVVGRQAPADCLTAFNAFSQGHVTGPLLGAGLRKLGMAVIDRGHHTEEVFSTADHIRLFEFDTLVIPGKSVQGKGVGLDGLLSDQPKLIRNHRIKWWIGAAGTFEPGTINRSKEQGVESISNFYGSSEFAPFALSCSINHSEFHISQGHVLVEVVDEHGTHVTNGKFGRIVVTHLSGLDEKGNSCVHTGTQIIRLAAGDGATYFDEPCECGLTTPRLYDIQRV